MKPKNTIAIVRVLRSFEKNKIEDAEHSQQRKRLDNGSTYSNVNLKETADSSETDKDLICFYSRVSSAMADPSTTSLESLSLSDCNGVFSLFFDVGFYLAFEFEFEFEFESSLFLDSPLFCVPHFPLLIGFEKFP